MKKKIVIVLIACSAVFIRFFIIYNLFKTDYVFYGFKMREFFSIDGGISDFGEIIKYYYSEKNDKKFEKSTDYQIVGENVELIKNKVNQLYDEYNELIFDYKFDLNIIDENDYYILDCVDCRTFHLYFYDIDAHILYYLVCNT